MQHALEARTRAADAAHARLAAAEARIGDTASALLVHLEMVESLQAWQKHSLLDYMFLTLTADKGTGKLH